MIDDNTKALDIDLRMIMLLVDKSKLSLKNRIKIIIGQTLCTKILYQHDKQKRDLCQLGDSIICVSTCNKLLATLKSFHYIFSCAILQLTTIFIKILTGIKCLLLTLIHLQKPFSNTKPKQIHYIPSPIPFPVKPPSWIRFRQSQAIPPLGTKIMLPHITSLKNKKTSTIHSVSQEILKNVLGLLISNVTILSVIIYKGEK